MRAGEPIFIRRPSLSRLASLGNYIAEGLAFEAEENSWVEIGGRARAVNTRVS